MKQRIAILTKSSRHKQYCVVGYDICNNKLVRLVSEDYDSQGSITDAHLTYSNGEIVSVLDLVDIEIKFDCPSETHPEDLLIDETKKWVFVEKFSLEKIPSDIYCSDEMIYLNTNPEITLSEVKQIKKSIIVAKVKNLTLYRSFSGKTKAKFDYNNEKYENFSVTDPEYYDITESYIEDAILIISLPNDKWSYAKNRFFKFIAKIYTNHELHSFSK